MLKILAFYVRKGFLPELWKVEEHLKVTVHIACVSLVDQANISLFIPYFIFFSQGKIDKKIRMYLLKFDPSKFLPFSAYFFPHNFQSLVGDPIFKKPRTLSMNINSVFFFLLKRHVLMHPDVAGDTELTIHNLNLKRQSFSSSGNHTTKFLLVEPGLSYLNHHFSCLLLEELLYLQILELITWHIFRQGHLLLRILPSGTSGCASAVRRNNQFSLASTFGDLRLVLLVFLLFHVYINHTRDSNQKLKPPDSTFKLIIHKSIPIMTLSIHLLFNTNIIYHQKFTPSPKPFSLPPLNFPGCFFT